jgi:hypothetical protein
MKGDRYIRQMHHLLRRACLPGSLLLSLTFLIAGQGMAQNSAFLPVDDNAYNYLDALISRGRLWQLSALERPYRIGAVKSAIASDTAAASSGVQRLKRQLSQSLLKYDASGLSDSTLDSKAMHVAITPYLFATAQTSGVRDLMHADSTNHVRPGFGAVGVVQMGSLLVGVRAQEDSRLKDDPQYLGQKNRWYVGRMEDAYIDGQFKYAELFAGRLGRNWGPSQLDGLLLGHTAYTYDHLYVKLGVPALNLSGVVTRLDDGFQSNGTSIDTARRYLGMHKLATQLGRFEASVSEAVVYGGVGEGIRPAYANPVTPFILSEVSDNNPGNIMESVEASWRSNIGQLSGQFLLDDVSKNSCGISCQKPNSYGYTVQAEGLPLLGDQRLYAWYTRVANLTYRNEAWYDSYTYQSVALGQGYSDYDEMRAGLDILPWFGVPLRAYVAYQRQGEGNYLQPHPTPGQYATTAQFLQGVVQQTTRVALSGTTTMLRFIQVSGDLGMNSVVNSQHIVGARTTSFVGRFQLLIESPWFLGGAFHPE